jgi:metal-dependent amidase/aminoacylase/carboxypeptidase family protein
VVAQTAIALLRQHLPSGDLVHGIVRHGGDAPNIVPERTVLDYMIRSETLDDLVALEERVGRCFEAGAIATGCTVAARRTAPAYSHIESDRDLTRYYGENARALGRKPMDLPRGRRLGSGSTDMANVTLALPAIHPGFGSRERLSLLTIPTLQPHAPHQTPMTACTSPPPHSPGQVSTSPVTRQCATACYVRERST